MASNSVGKQKDKLLLDLSSQKEKIEKYLSSLKNTLLLIEEGDGVPYWNGENAYQVINNIHSYISKGYDLLEMIHECESSLKKFH